MKRSKVHPQIRARLDKTLAARKRKLAADRAACIVKLQNAIDLLNESLCAQDDEKAKLLIEIFEWARAELKADELDPGISAERIAAVGRLLKRFSTFTG